MIARILVSSCLLGQPVRYDGRAKTLEDTLLSRWRGEGRIVPFCPEVAAGLPTPRPPAEIEPGATAAQVLAGRARILTTTGEDVSDAFRQAAELTLVAANRADARFALLTDGSPSCGTGFVYTGHHDGTRQPGRGVVAELLIASGLQCFAPSRINDLAAALPD